MYGLEKKAKATFEFDLEKDLKSDPNKARQILKTVDERVVEIKGLLRQGAQSKDFDNYGVLLHGYTALQRVLKRIENAKKK